MKYIFNNQHVECIKFSSFAEQFTFVNNQKELKSLTLDSAYRDNYYSLIGYDSLTKNKLFVVSFSSDEKEHGLNLLFWDKNQLYVLTTGENVYLIDLSINVKEVFNILTPLIGVWITDTGNLLILEEAGMRLINKDAKVLVEDQFDLIENFSIQNDVLKIYTSEENKIFDLSSFGF